MKHEDVVGRPVPSFFAWVPSFCPCPASPYLTSHAKPSSRHPANRVTHPVATAGGCPSTKLACISNFHFRGGLAGVVVVAANRTEPNRASSTQLEPTQTERLTSRTAAYIFYTGLSGPGSDKPAACNRIKCSTDSDMRRLCSRVAQACPFQSVIRTGSVVFIQSLRTASIR